jgi:hypothetical protein
MHRSFLQHQEKHVLNSIFEANGMICSSSLTLIEWSTYMYWYPSWRERLQSFCSTICALYVHSCCTCIECFWSSAFWQAVRIPTFNEEWRFLGEALPYLILCLSLDKFCFTRYMLLPPECAILILLSPDCWCVTSFNCVLRNFSSFSLWMHHSANKNLSSDLWNLCQQRLMNYL